MSSSSSSSTSSCPKTPKVALPTKSETTSKKTDDELQSASIGESGHIEKCDSQTDEGNTKTPGLLRSAGVFVTPSTAGTRSDESIQLSTGHSGTVTDPAQVMQTPSSQIKMEEPSTSSTTEETSRRLAFASPPTGELEKNLETGATEETTPKPLEQKSNQKGTSKRKQRQTMPDLGQYYLSNERVTIGPHESLNVESLPRALQPKLSPMPSESPSNESVVVKDEKCNDDNTTEPKSKRRKL